MRERHFQAGSIKPTHQPSLCKLRLILPIDQTLHSKRYNFAIQRCARLQLVWKRHQSPKPVTRSQVYRITTKGGSSQQTNRSRRQPGFKRNLINVASADAQVAESRRKDDKKNLQRARASSQISEGVEMSMDTLSSSMLSLPSSPLFHRSLSAERRSVTTTVTDGQTQENSRTSASQSEQPPRHAGQNCSNSLQGDSGSSSESSRSESAPSLPPPKHPEYRSLESRLASFVGWPERLVGQSPHSLAACGFFYIGSADRVRCFQCGVTLRNWEAEDDPATEHLTWAPECPVALLPPGAQSQTGFLDVQAPPESGGESGAGEGGEGPGFESPSRNFEQLGVNIAGAESNAEATRAQSGVARSSDPTQHNGASGATSAASTGATASAAAAGGDPPFVQAVLELGCSRDTVDRVRERRRREEGTDFPDAQSLLQAVWEEESNNQTTIPAPSDSSAQTNQTQASSSSTDTINGTNAAAPYVTNGNENAGSKSEAQVKRRQPRFRQCHLCPQGEVSVTFLPCGHLIACSSCAEKCQVCPRCGKTILGTVKTYFA